MALTFLAALLAGATGFVTALLLARAKETRLTVELAGARATLEAERKASEEKMATFLEAEGRLGHAFQSMAADALRTSQEHLVAMAKNELAAKQASVEQTLKPVAETLRRFDEQVRQVEKDRAGAYAGLMEQVKGLSAAQEMLRSQAAGLVAALAKPTVRGRWGEMQLRRVVELAGMMEHCDFEEQSVTASPEGAARPDVIIKLVGGKKVVIDAKAPLAAYLEAAQATDAPGRAAKLKDFVRQVKTHVEQLGGKAYWERITPTPEFVVMFLPGEAFLAAALEEEPGLIEAAMARKVVLAGPTVLIPLLSVVAWGWKQERMAKGAEEVARLGGELHKRLRTMAEYFAKVGGGLEAAVKAYNEAAASMETRVMVTARKLSEHQVAGGEELPMPRLVEATVRPITREERLELPPGVTLPVVTGVR